MRIICREMSRTAKGSIPIDTIEINGYDMNMHCKDRCKKGHGSKIRSPILYKAHLALNRGHLPGHNLLCIAICHPRPTRIMIKLIQMIVDCRIKSKPAKMQTKLVLQLRRIKEVWKIPSKMTIIIHF